MIKLTNLILENNLREYSEEEKRKMGIPSGATSRGGVWYVGDKYAGQVVKGKFVAAAKTQPAGSGEKPPKDKTKIKAAPAETPELELPPRAKETIARYVGYIKDIDEEIKKATERLKEYEVDKKEAEDIIADKTTRSTFLPAAKKHLERINKRIAHEQKKINYALGKRTEFEDDVKSVIDHVKTHGTW